MRAAGSYKISKAIYYVGKQPWIDAARIKYGVQRASLNIKLFILAERDRNLP